MTDAVGRSWQMGTVQLDFQMPARFEMTYVGVDNADHSRRWCTARCLAPRALHRHPDRAPRGAFPLWLAPLPASSSGRRPPPEYADAVAAELRATGLRAEADLRTESVGKKIAEAEHQRIPCILVVGDREADAETASVGRRRKGDLGARPLADLRAALLAESRRPKLGLTTRGQTPHLPSLHIRHARARVDVPAGPRRRLNSQDVSRPRHGVRCGV